MHSNLQYQNVSSANVPQTSHLHIQDTEEEMKLVYKDNGGGFLVKQGLKEAGLGLKNIKSRVAILNGELLIKSQLNQGATFTINIKHT